MRQRTRTAQNRLASASGPEAAPKQEGGALMFDTPQAIDRYRVIALLHGLKLQALGINVTAGTTCLVIARRDYGIRARTAEQAAVKLEARLLKLGIISR